MTRRTFFATMVAVLGLGGVATAQQPAGLRKVWRQHYKGTKLTWQQVRMKDVLVGDLVKIEELPGVHRVTHRPKQGEDGVWGIMTVPA